MLENNKCAHHLVYDKDNDTCFLIEDLKKISKFYNNCNIGKEITIVNDKIQLINQLNNRLSHCNNDQICWLNQ